MGAISSGKSIDIVDNNRIISIFDYILLSCHKV